MSKEQVLVVGATGATGSHVVQMLLDKGYHVTVIVRSKSSMLEKIKSTDNIKHLLIHEAPILDIPEQELAELTNDCKAIVSCLGHNMNFQGIFGKPRCLVTDTVKRLVSIMPASTKFILMGSNGVAHPGGVDPTRNFRDRVLLAMFRSLIPPHSDNEMAADFLYSHGKACDWIIVRPTDLIDEDNATGKYEIYELSEGSLFGNSVVSRANVAHFMTELVTDDKVFNMYNHQLPVIKHKS